MLIKLYAQPVSRIVLLTLDEVTRNNDQVFVRFGEPPSPVPEPFASLLLRYLDNRTNMGTATNPNSRWLFPGRRANQPLRTETLGKHLSRMGIPTTAGRSAAIRQHVQDNPAPIVADALGYHPTTTARIAAETGTTFSRYAPGDHTHSPRPLPKRRTHDS